MPIAVPKHWFRKQDYRLVQKKSGDGLEPWERSLYDGLFDNRTEVLLSELKTTFAHTIIEARKQLYTESATNAWFAGDPEKTRNYWSSAGILVAHRIEDFGVEAAARTLLAPRQVHQG